MAFGTAPFGTRSFDDMIARRLEERRRLKDIASASQAGPETFLRADPLAPGPIGPPGPEQPVVAESPQNPSFLRSLLSGPGLSAGIKAGLGSRNFLEGLAGGFASASDAGRAEEAAAIGRADKERQFGLDERRVGAEETRAARTPVARTASETTAEELAATCQTINYEIVSSVGRRVPRVFIRGGRPVAIRSILGTAPLGGAALPGGGPK